MRFDQSALFTLLLAAALPAAALAAGPYSYTFQVPITATNLPAGSALYAICVGYPAVAASVGLSSPPLAVTNGSYNGTATVTLISKAPFATYMCSAAVMMNGVIVNFQNPGSLSPTTTPGWRGTMLVKAAL
jgi:hypothetical protein